MSEIDGRVAEFIEAGCIPLDNWHSSGTLERAEAILAAHPEVAGANIYVAAILGDEVGVRHFLAIDPASATRTGGPRGWDPLSHLCFSRYLRIDRARTAGFVGAARALLDAGAPANTGFFEKNHHPEPTWESALYGAVGIAHHAELTRLLLERGADPNDPNDDETAYHAAEGYDNDAMKVLVEVGKLNADGLATMLLRKADWHDYDGMQWLLDQGVDPNRTTRWGRTTLHHAIHRDNRIEMITLLLDHGADPTIAMTQGDTIRPAYRGKSAVAMAARRGRGDVLDLFANRGVSTELEGVERLIAACARSDETAIRSLPELEPSRVSEIVAEGGTLLAEFAGNGNTEGVRHLLDLGIDVATPYADGDGYFEIPKGSLAIHVAAWRGRHATVKFLIDRGSPIDQPDTNGRTPLALAVRACVDSHWKNRRSPESVEALLAAGASAAGIDIPTGYPEVDQLLSSYQR